jgi:hypothetical protein
MVRTYTSAFAALLLLASAAAASQDQTDAPSVALAETLRDGMRIVTGRLVPKTDAVSTIRVTVKRSALSNVLTRQNYVQQKSTTDIAADGSFTLTLDQPLRAGQVVVAEAMNADGPIDGSGSEIVEVIDPGSWGRARAYFAGGVTFSKERDDFSKQDLSVSFVIDKTWLQATDFELGAPKATRDEFNLLRTRVSELSHQRQAQVARLTERRDPTRSRGAWRMRQLNSFFDARVTALPLVVEGDGSDVATSEQFLSTRKGALVQVGIYAPIYGPQTAWEHDGAIHTLFIAPVVRGGIATIAGGDDDDQLSSTDVDDVHQFWSAGIGLGLYRLTGTTNQAPELINYLHATWGRSESFEFTESGVVQKPLRLFIEARLMVPSTALQVGFDANLGDGRDDVRFVFGTRFDIGELIARLSSFQ